jgi:hypothetical protein
MIRIVGGFLVLALALALFGMVTPTHVEAATIGNTGGSTGLSFRPYYYDASAFNRCLFIFIDTA